MWIGFFLVVVGILAILDNMHIIKGDFWDYIWPLFFIFLGASLVWKHRRKDEIRHDKYDNRSHIQP